MAIDVTMPALSPTMEVGTLAKWHVKPGDVVKSGDIIAEIETDKATMEVEAVDEGTVIEIAVPEGLENVPVGTVILRLAGEGESSAPPPKPVPVAAPAPAAVPVAPAAPAAPAPSATPSGDRIIASPLARRIAELQGVDLATVAGSGPRGRIVRADVEAAAGKPAVAAPVAPAPSPVPAEPVAPRAPAPAAPVTSDIPHSVEKLGNVRKVIARRLTEAKQSIPHIYLTLDVELDALLKLRGELNKALEPRGIKVSVNDLVIKALALGLRQVPKCNVSFAGENLLVYERADISVAVAAPSGLITPIITGADGKAVSQIAAEMKALAEKARAGKLQPHEYQGGTASLSNLGMFGIKQFEAVINPPQAMILAVGAGEKRAVVKGDALAIATVMTITGSFDHRAIDGADGAELMSAVKALIENPLGLVA
ncbi:pyruvate dehydrogenase complex dihydrolipoamide acetyltransferase [Sandarakinorhabdus cyanobacteriorum]|uniref:Acetyltransferase component of pyruvate dehydrogenase complex n=1 Tax=Sandarakinorhabdus cyanobacteriorum TaxID=1981098 RepID=A0A255YG31_9SPHN|nr:pyruvate dehydrogenase complex dihydrolipoamide acetyltransferase [Sandarakinorhabdus cyanobacteriorum]OYQ28217.1 pyruvate dehydrogenase complex dihydrolipoamide acetyltransferase [Sandarakinorhabdus cyanobacteriorum]